MAEGRWRTRWPVVVVVFLGLIFLLLVDLSASLGRIQVPGLPARSIGSVQSAFVPEEAVAKARQAWCLWNGYGGRTVGALPENRTIGCVRAFDTAANASAPGGVVAGRMVWAYIGLDALFLFLYVCVLIALYRWLRSRAPGDPEIQGPLRRAVIVVLAVGLLAGLLAGALEGVAHATLVSAAASEAQVDVAGQILAFAPIVKVVGLAVPGLLLLGLALRVLRRQSLERNEKSMPIWPALSRLRIQVVIVLVFALIASGVGQNQVADALLRLVDFENAVGLGLIQVVASAVALWLLSILIWRSAYRMVFAGSENARKLIPPRPVLLLVVALATGIVGFWWRNLWGLTVILVVIAGLSWWAGAPFWRWREPEDIARRSDFDEVVDARTSQASERSRVYAIQLACWLAAAPIIAVGVAMVRAALPPWLALDKSDLPGGRLLGAGAFGLVVLCLAFVTVRALQKWTEVRRRQEVRRDVFYLVCLGLLVAVYVVVAIPPSRQAFPVLVGPIALVAFFLAAVLIVGSELQRRVERMVPVAGLRIFHIKRNPLLLLVVCWLVLGRLLDVSGPHAVRTENYGKARGAYSIATAFDNWARANCAFDVSSTAPVPMVFVAAEGGGIRAAYWTAGVLDTVFPTEGRARTGTCETRRNDQVFALSGASGGSVGIAFWLNAPSATRPSYQRTAVIGNSPRWYDTALTADYLSPLVGRMLYVDVPRSLLGYAGADRAAVLEESWEASQPALSKGFLSSYVPAGGDWRPIALLNAASVESGCRALVSPVELTRLDARGPGSLGCRRLSDAQPASAVPAGEHNATGLYDVANVFLCGNQDLPASTAALLSARFPYVTPSGQLTQCTANGKDGETPPRTYIVDGGYLDNSGSMSATDLYLRVKPLIDAHNALARDGGDRRPIKPLLVQVDNGYPAVAEGADLERPYELLVPPRTRLAVAGALEPAARQRSYEVFGADGYVRIANTPHPGVQAPLGWALSGSAQYELCQELTKAKGQFANLAEALGTNAPTTAECVPAQGDLLADATGAGG